MVWQGRCLSCGVHGQLSIRESQILRLVAAGMTTKEIAAALSIADSTVNWHVGNVLAKLGASSRAEAVAIMLREGPAEQPIITVGPRRRTVAAPVAALLALGILLLAAGGTSLAAWYLRPQPAAPTDRAPSPAITATPAPTDGQRAPGTSSGSPVPQGRPATARPVAPTPISSPAAPVTTSARPLATAPLAPGTLLSPTPTLLPILPLPALPATPLPRLGLP